jgi:hypothetical protein
MLMQPSPIAETSRLLFPSLRFFIAVRSGNVDGLQKASASKPAAIGCSPFDKGRSTSLIPPFSDSYRAITFIQITSSEYRFDLPHLKEYRSSSRIPEGR